MTVVARHGSCACGHVRFTVTGDLPPPDACHCTTCRKISGHYFVSTDVPRSALVIVGEDRIGWWPSSDRVRRGFCTSCGSSLFWDAPAKEWIGVAMGALDDASGTQVSVHVHTGEKGDYYSLPEGEPHHVTVPHA